MVRKLVLLAVVLVFPLCLVATGVGCGTGTSGNPKVASDKVPANAPKPMTPGGAPGGRGGGRNNSSE